MELKVSVISILLSTYTRHSTLCLSFQDSQTNVSDISISSIENTFGLVCVDETSHDRHRVSVAAGTARSVYTGQCCCYERFFGVFRRTVISCKFFCRFYIYFAILNSYFCGFSFVDFLFIDWTTFFGDPARTLVLFKRFFVVREVLK